MSTPTTPTELEPQLEFEQFTFTGSSLDFELEPMGSFTVDTLPASNITFNSATLNGEINNVDETSDGNKKGFVWDTESKEDPGDTSPENSNYSNVVDKGDLVDGEFNYNLTELDPDNEYYYRAFGYDGEEYIYGEQKSFQTPPFVELTTEPATNVDITTATLNADITEINSPFVNVRFLYSIVGSGIWEETTPEEVTTTGTFSQDVEGLTQDSDYKFEVVAEYNGHEEAGEKLFFTTEEGFLEYNYNTVRNVKDGNATFRVSLTEFVGTVDVKFQYKKITSSGWLESTSQNIDTPQMVSITVSNLDPTRYEFRAVFDDSEIGQVVGETLRFNNGTPGAFWNNAVKKFDSKYDDSREEQAYEIVF